MQCSRPTMKVWCEHWKTSLVDSLSQYTIFNSMRYFSFEICLLWCCVAFFFTRFYEFLLSFFCCRCRHSSYNACVFSVWLFSKNFFFYGIFSPLCCICLRIYLLPCYYVHTYTMHIKAIARSQCGWTQEEKKAHTHRERSSIHTPDIRNMYFCFLCDFSFCFVTLFRIPFFSFTISFSPIFPYAKYYVCFMLFSTSLKHFCSLSFLNNEIRYCEENMVSKSNWELMHITEINSLAVTLDDRFYRECVFLFRHSSFRKWCFESIFWCAEPMQIHTNRKRVSVVGSCVWVCVCFGLSIVNS